MKRSSLGASAGGEATGSSAVSSSRVSSATGRPPRVWSDVSSAELLQLAQDVATGLHYLHANGVTHRDVKHANVMVDERGPHSVRAKLCDFGISALKNATQEQQESRSFSSIGTPRYQVTSCDISSLAPHTGAQVLSCPHRNRECGSAKCAPSEIIPAAACLLIRRRR